MTTEAIDSKKVMEELKTIKEDLNYLKEHMVDIDSIMTEDDYKALKDYREEKKKGKLISHEQLREQLRI